MLTRSPTDSWLGVARLFLSGRRTGLPKFLGSHLYSSRFADALARIGLERWVDCWAVRHNFDLLLNPPVPMKRLHGIVGPAESLHTVQPNEHPMSQTLSVDETVRNPLWKLSSIFLVAISLSIGWGIRGDFGHESGAWIPGALSAIAICVVSRREDWQSRIPFCALLGGLGWGFGGSISYMFPMSFIDSGQWESMLYGYYTLFFEGGLWAGMGAAGTVLPLIMDRDRLTRFMKPFLVVLGAMVLNQLTLAYVANFFDIVAATASREGVLERHKGPLYWMDSDWMSALWALLGVCVYELYSRRFSKVHLLIAFLVVGAAGGWAIQKGMDTTGLTPKLVSAVVVPLGEAGTINPKTGVENDPTNFMVNWPQFFGDYPQHLGWWFGAIAGVILYFSLYGEWKDDSGLFVYMALGWWIAFLAMPVFGTIFLLDYGGFRMTPPRGDNWAGVLGVLVGTGLYGLRNGLAPLAYAGAMNFILGGIGFATVKIVRQMLLIPGHPELPPKDPVVLDAWKHYHSANWHSMLEQSHGFCHGVATAITMALLWRKLSPVNNEPRERRWTEAIAIVLSVFFLTYVNVVKNVSEWVKGAHQLVPPMMKAPLIESINLSATAWFNLAWCAMSLACLALLFLHLRRPLAIVPSNWLGKGQLIYVLILWIMVIADFERSLNGFSEQRLVTEWVIIINASIATFLVVALPGANVIVPGQQITNYGTRVLRILLIGIPMALLITTGYTALQYKFYKGTKLGTAHYRFGPDALWRREPILKNKKHL